MAGIIVQKLQEAYASKALAEGQSGDWHPRPSGLGGCLREMAWIISGAEREPRTPESIRLLELGTQRGEALEAIAKTCWPDAEVQVPVQVPVPWGKMPGKVDLWIPSLRTIVDFKTAGGYSMGLIVAGEKQDEGYALQLNAYRHGIVEIERADDYPCSLGEIRAVLVYEAKDSDARKGVTAGMLHEVEIPYTAALEEAYQKRLQEIWNLLESRRSGSLKPESVQGVMDTKQEWRCAMFKNGRPKYCSIGTIRGHCNGE